jgi:dGTPase
LGLNTDLVEAIALGHDVGHPPFGHEGEGYLSALSREYGEGSFSHPWQSCRLFREVEPLNLGLAVYDGFLCHDGGMREHTLKPRKEKSWEEHLQDLERKHQAPGRDIQPGTLEGCLVKLCDTMSYLGRDIEDAISLGVIHREQIPLTQLGSSNREFLAHIAADIIRNSRGKDYIAVSETTFAALKTVRAFNFKHIYSHAPIKAQSPKVKRSYRILFEYLLKDLEQAAEDSYIWTHFIHNKPEAYRQETRPARLVIDFIAGMTDGYFVKTLERLIVPQRIDLL